MTAALTKDIDVVTTGEAMGLLLAGSTSSLALATSFTCSVAGAESNVAIGLSRLGHRVAFAGRVGSDAAGAWVRRTMLAEGVDVSALTAHSDAPTGLLMRDAPGEIRATQVEYRRAGSASSNLRMDTATERLVQRAGVVFVSGITAMLSPAARAYVDDVLAVADASAATVVFDPNVRLRLAPLEQWRSTMAELVPRCDILLMGDDEAAQLGMPQDPRRLLGRRTHTAVVKLGAAGASMAGPHGETHCEARRLPVVDVVGAGDAFTAGWLSAWLRGLSDDQTMYEAAWVASCVVADRSDIAGLPTAEERDTAIYGGTDVRR